MPSPPRSGADGGVRRMRPVRCSATVSRRRVAVIGVAVFAFLFSRLVPTTTYINMFLAITSAMFFGAGVCIIGGFYWRKGTRTRRNS